MPLQTFKLYNPANLKFQKENNHVQNTNNEFQLRGWNILLIEPDAEISLSNQNNCN